MICSSHVAQLMLRFIVSKSVHDMDQLLFNIGNASLSICPSSAV